jgi:hypothetical protein
VPDPKADGVSKKLRKHEKSSPKIGSKIVLLFRTAAKRIFLTQSSRSHGCDYTYDQLQDLSENHIKLRAIMNIGSWDADTEFKWRTIRNNICQLKPQTID